MKCCREKAVAMEGICKNGIYNKEMYGNTGT